MASCQRFNRVRSAATPWVNLLQAKKVNDHKNLQMKTSGQLRNQGSCNEIEFSMRHGLDRKLAGQTNKGLELAMFTIGLAGQQVE